MFDIAWSLQQAELADKNSKYEISLNSPIYPGDIVEMHFKLVGGWTIIHSAEKEFIKFRLRNSFPDLQIIKEQTESGFYIITLQRRLYDPNTNNIQSASPITAGIIAAAVIGGGLLFYFSLHKVYKITDSPAGQIALAGSGAMGFAVVLLAIIALLSYYRKKS